MTAHQYPIGVDISKWQGDVDFSAMLPRGVRFCFVKATEGRGYRDPRFADNWRKLRDLDGKMYRGAYHFARYDTEGGAADGTAEAHDFCDALREFEPGDPAGWRGVLPPVVDIEKYGKHGRAANRAWLAAFRQVVRARLGRDPIIYTGRNVWRYQLGAAPDAPTPPLWLVAYTKRTDRAPRLPIGWDRWTFWQWSGGGEYDHYRPRFGQMPGVRGSIDVNFYSGSEADLEQLCDWRAPDPICPPTQPRGSSLGGWLRRLLDSETLPR